MNSGGFPLGKQARFTSRTFVPGCPQEKFMNWPFLVWSAGLTPEKEEWHETGHADDWVILTNRDWV